MPPHVTWEFIIIALCVYSATAKKSFISLRDEDFDREDPRILEELRRRTDHDQLIKSFRAPKLMGGPGTEPAPNKHANLTTQNPVRITNFRRYEQEFIGTTDRRFPQEPRDRAARHKMIEMVEQAIFAAQYRLKDLEPTAKKYQDTIEFRISFIFQRLQAIEKEMASIYTILLKDSWDPWYKNVLTVYYYIVYYQMVLMKNVDVQYICEHLFQMHTHVENTIGQERMAAMEQVKAQKMGAANLPGGGGGFPGAAPGDPSGQQTLPPGETMPSGATLPPGMTTPPSRK